MTEQQTMELSFDVDAALLVELGERLVSRRSVALAELIKNAYDADATEVIVSFENVRSSVGEIVVKDNGIGISFDGLRNVWMRIATTDAAVNSKSKKYGRPKTGAKGVGRFACRRLAFCLSLESISMGPYGLERVSANFDWRDFKPGMEMSEVKTNINREPVDGGLDTGTTLRFSQLTDIWGARDLAEIQRELNALVDPHKSKDYVQKRPNYDPDPGFTTRIQSPEFPEYEGSIEDRFLAAAWGELSGRVTDKGQPEYNLRIRNSDTILVHRPLQISFPELASAEFTIRMMVYSAGSFRGTNFRLADARNLGREHGGVKVYLDGFRVFSYGAPGDDWLELDQDGARRLVTTPNELVEEAAGLRRPMLSLPGNMQLFGSVAISRDNNPGIAVSISRERLVENDSFNQLRTFVRSGINWLTVCYARELAKSRVPESKSEAASEDSSSALRTVRNLVSQEPSLTREARLNIETSLSKAENLVASEREAYISELAMLRVIASAGTTVLIFDHTLRAMGGQLQGVVRRLEAAERHLPEGVKDRFQQTLSDLSSWSSMAIGQGSLVGLLVGPEARTRSTSLAIRPLVESLQRGFLGYTSRFGIAFDNKVPPALRTPPMQEAELYAVLLNVLTNSFKAVRDVPARRVCIEAVGGRQEISLKVHDSGIGIPNDLRERVFEPFVTTSQPDPVLGVGTGLGLKIARDLVRSWGGDINVVEAIAPWQTTIEILIPRQ